MSKLRRRQDLHLKGFPCRTVPVHATTSSLSNKPPDDPPHALSLELVAREVLDHPLGVGEARIHASHKFVLRTDRVRQRQACREERACLVFTCIGMSSNAAHVAKVRRRRVRIAQEPARPHVLPCLAHGCLASGSAALGRDEERPQLTHVPIIFDQTGPHPSCLPGTTCCCCCLVAK